MVALAASIASCSVLKRNTGASGPKVSSVATSMSAVAPEITVGSKNWPFIFSPPVSTLPPFLTASATCLATFFTAASSINGPIATPSSKPLPTFILATLAASFLTNLS